MLPTLLIGSIAIPTYPLLLLAALWTGMWFASIRARQLGLDGDHVYNAGLYGLIAGIIGARLWFVLSHWENYADNIGQAFSLSRSALSTGEGLVIAGVVVLIYLQRNRVPLATFFDATAPGLALALVIGNVGAFLGGVSLGLPTNVPWAIEIARTPRHPVQLYEAGAGGIIFFILLGARRQTPWSGFHFWLLVALYSLSRLLLEPLQARPYVTGNGFLTMQIVALVALVVALLVLAYNFTTISETTG